MNPSSSAKIFVAGLWIREDAALTWKKVDRFPETTAPAPPGDAAAAAPRGRPGAGGGGGRGAGLSFVVFAPSTGTRGKPTPTIYVGSTEPGTNHLFRSTDASQTWLPVPGQPPSLLAIHAAFDTQGVLYLVYRNGVGPGGVTDGAIGKLNPKDGAWTDITPVKDANRFPGGYGGLGVDLQHPGTVVAASLDRKDPRPGGEDDDRIYRTTDGGMTWTGISPKSHRDSSAAPCVPWAGVYDATVAKPEASVGWWIDRLAIDPFDSKHVCYATGTIIWNTVDINNADSGGDTHWTIWADGIEETCVANVISPTAGAHMTTAVADVGGFTHGDLDVSRAQGPNLRPLFANFRRRGRYLGPHQRCAAPMGQPVRLSGGRPAHLWACVYRHLWPWSFLRRYRQLSRETWSETIMYATILYPGEKGNSHE